MVVATESDPEHFAVTFVSERFYVYSACIIASLVIKSIDINTTSHWLRWLQSERGSYAHEVCFLVHGSSKDTHIDILSIDKEHYRSLGIA